MPLRRNSIPTQAPWIVTSLRVADQHHLGKLSTNSSVCPLQHHSEIRNHIAHISECARWQLFRVLEVGLGEKTDKPPKEHEISHFQIKSNKMTIARPFQNENLH